MAPVDSERYRRQSYASSRFAYQTQLSHGKAQRKQEKMSNKSIKSLKNYSRSESALKINLGSKRCSYPNPEKLDASMKQFFETEKNDEIGDLMRG